jgi:hypothetical protein
LTSTYSDAISAIVSNPNLISASTFTQLNLSLFTPPKMFAKLKAKLPTTRTNEISEEDLKKYTGMTKTQLGEWAQDRPDVGGNQLAGKINMGSAGGGGIPNSFSYTGRGDSAAAEMKFPPKPKREKEQELAKEKEEALAEESE